MRLGSLLGGGSILGFLRGMIRLLMRRLSLNYSSQVRGVFQKTFFWGFERRISRFLLIVRVILGIFDHSGACLMFILIVLDKKILREIKILEDVKDCTNVVKLLQKSQLERHNSHALVIIQKKSKTQFLDF